MARVCVGCGFAVGEGGTLEIAGGPWDETYPGCDPSDLDKVRCADDGTLHGRPWIAPTLGDLLVSDPVPEVSMNVGDIVCGDTHTQSWTNEECRDMEIMCMVLSGSIHIGTSDNHPDSFAVGRTDLDFSVNAPADVPPASDTENIVLLSSSDPEWGIAGIWSGRRVVDIRFFTLSPGDTLNVSIRQCIQCFGGNITGEAHASRVVLMGWGT